MSEPKAALPPLVEPAAGLTSEETRRYSRHLIIPEFGMPAQQRLKNARVLVIGAGGLGSPALLYLAAAGVGTLGIVDDDTVDESNLQRQIIHGVSDLGSSKAESARRSIRELNPLVNVQLHPVRLDADNVLEIFAGYDLILDGTDNFATRYLVNDAAEILGKPYVWGSILRFDGQVSVFWGRHGPTYRDLYPEAPPAGSVPSCAEGGVLGVLCAQIGSVMVNEAVKLITGTGVTLLGRVLVLNALDMSWREIRLRKDPAAEPVTELEEDYEAFCGMPPEGGQGTGDEAPAVGVRELQLLLAARAAGERDFDLIDVREPGEHAIVSIEGAELMPRAGILAGDNLPARGRDLYVHCKSGGRSAEVAAFLRGQGYDRVFNVDGGILAWVREIEPAKVLY
ncbi:molybdopterin-synthase adenylyltransferase MoeB [Arthrobacter gengyunqii]|uniref:Molybdopterin-synthase adenylyltransferase MoeB n=1 Tax=Arthrobacter gengyunqii TaxID=2886940 RepID=A0ABS8GLL1_9MICC|nr:molybdopterin-synthase adenylyltransferase MoeB [Arthrobacter gengyunqii]MCC3267238.1 molybdopterin-synthase adenylyltransferase MoeB [Arthrobacter gengyunqii]